MASNYVDEEVEENTAIKQCTKARICSKEDKHTGKCDKNKKFSPFWKSSRFQIRNLFQKKKKEVEIDYERKTLQLADIDEREKNIQVQLADLDEREKNILEKEKEAEEKLQKVKEEVKLQAEQVEALKKEYERLKYILGQTQQSRSKRIQNPTTFEMVMDVKSSTRYRRRHETKDALDYIHGGSDGALNGAWDLVAACASQEMMDKLIGGYKRGKYLQGVFGKAVKEYNNSDDALKQAVAMKYQHYLSRRKFQLVCKTQSSVFNADEEIWLPRNIKCLETSIRLPNIAGDSRVDQFVKSLDIGNVCQISYYPGVSRTVTGLVYMIIDLHLRLPRLRKQLRWFNGNSNHFIFQFSDDGAPETSELGMSIGSLTCWNFESRVRSREFHYLLHCLSVSEKDAIMEDLWRQHADEMQLLEGNVLTVCNTQCTVEFQPSADQSWQSWASNELNQAATYPSPFANVHKGNLSKIGGSIGMDSTCTWKPSTQESREKAIENLKDFEKRLPQHLSSSSRHDRKLEFMANNGIRQLGEPRIGEFANRLRPEPMHCEINAWQHMMNMAYKEALQRNKIDSFLEVLGAPVEATDKQVQEHPVSSSLPVKCNNGDNYIDRKHVEGSGERVRQVESVRRQSEIFEQNMMSASKAKECSTSSAPVAGCGLPFVACKVKEHYDNKDKRANNLSARLIGEQAIALAKYYYRLIDALEILEESPAQKIKRQVLGKAGQHLRNAGTLFNKVDTNEVEVEQLKENFTTYFNLLALFFKPAVNVTVWTVAYAIPYHASLLFQNYKLGYGILSLQAKESKHAGIKHDLLLTNRSRSTGSLGKWWQVMRANYVRSFYLPEHHPMPSMYVSHYKSRMPSHLTCNNSLYCECGRKKVDPDEELCGFCAECSAVLECAFKQELLPAVYNILKPISCPLCTERFADQLSCDQHKTLFHYQGIHSSGSIIPKQLSVASLREELKKRGLSTTGSKSILVTRLEGRLACEI